MCLPLLDLLLMEKASVVLNGRLNRRNVYVEFKSSKYFAIPLYDFISTLPQIVCNGILSKTRMNLPDAIVASFEKRECVHLYEMRPPAGPALEPPLRSAPGSHIVGSVSILIVIPKLHKLGIHLSKGIPLVDIIHNVSKASPASAYLVVKRLISFNSR